MTKIRLQVGFSRICLLAAHYSVWIFIRAPRMASCESLQKAITSQDLDLDGVSEISVRAVRDDGTSAVIQIKDSMTDEPIKWIGRPVD